MLGADRITAVMRALAALRREMEEEGKVYKVSRFSRGSAKKGTLYAMLKGTINLYAFIREMRQYDTLWKSNHPESQEESAGLVDFIESNPRDTVRAINNFKELKRLLGNRDQQISREGISELDNRLFHHIVGLLHEANDVVKGLLDWSLSRIETRLKHSFEHLGGLKTDTAHKKTSHKKGRNLFGEYVFKMKGEYSTEETSKFISVIEKMLGLLKQEEKISSLYDLPAI